MMGGRVPLYMPFVDSYMYACLCSAYMDRIWHMIYDL